MVEHSTPHLPATGSAGRIYLDVAYADKDGRRNWARGWIRRRSGCSTRGRPRPVWTGGPPALRIPIRCRGRTEHSGLVRGHRLRSARHLSTHLGYANANVIGSAEQAPADLRAIIGMTEAQAWRHVAAADEAWTTRSGRVWTLDRSMLTDAGVTVVRPEQAADRPAAARRAADQRPRVAPPRPAPPTTGRTPLPTGEPPSVPDTVAPLTHPAGEAQRVTVRGRLRC